MFKRSALIVCEGPALFWSVLRACLCGEYVVLLVDLAVYMPRVVTDVAGWDIFHPQCCDTSARPALETKMVTRATKKDSAD